ncbi:uncharacterized protein LOC141708661 isoform X1 [Apium graveolens]|uniref:uncharacterized protein LOC141708661 isoform X1 n=1 Tax=Apium graveolens TaxID=4045 RepID=UPI003D7B8BF7
MASRVSFSHSIDDSLFSLEIHVLTLYVSVLLLISIWLLLSCSLVYIVLLSCSSSLTWCNSNSRCKLKTLCLWFTGYELSILLLQFYGASSFGLELMCGNWLVNQPLSYSTRFLFYLLVASKGHLLSDGIIRQGYCCIIWGHTLGKAHVDRSGFDGAWTKEPLK